MSNLYKLQEKQNELHKEIKAELEKQFPLGSVVNMTLNSTQKKLSLGEVISIRERDMRVRIRVITDRMHANKNYSRDVHFSKIVEINRGK